MLIPIQDIHIPTPVLIIYPHSYNLLPLLIVYSLIVYSHSFHNSHNFYLACIFSHCEKTKNEKIDKVNSIDSQFVKTFWESLHYSAWLLFSYSTIKSNIIVDQSIYFVFKFWRRKSSSEMSTLCSWPNLLTWKLYTKLYIESWK